MCAYVAKQWQYMLHNCSVPEVGLAVDLLWMSYHTLFIYDPC